MKVHILPHIVDTIKVDPGSESQIQSTFCTDDFEFVVVKHEQDPLAEVLQMSDTKAGLRDIITIKQ
jgi:hypothetical protein